MGNWSKINPGKWQIFRAGKVTVNLPAFTSNPPQIHHQKTTFCTPLLPNPQQKRVNQPRKKLVQKRSLFGLVLGQRDARAEGVDEVRNVVVEQDAGKDVFGGADGHGSFEQALVA